VLHGARAYHRQQHRSVAPPHGMVRGLIHRPTKDGAAHRLGQRSRRRAAVARAATTDVVERHEAQRLEHSLGGGEVARRSAEGVGEGGQRKLRSCAQLAAHEEAAHRLGDTPLAGCSLGEGVVRRLQRQTRKGEDVRRRRGEPAHWDACGACCEQRERARRFARAL
jgi:hypothetical protein